jgi:vancomycin resistance protein YoaR
VASEPATSRFATKILVDDDVAEAFTEPEVAKSTSYAETSSNVAPPEVVVPPVVVSPVTPPTVQPVFPAPVVKPQTAVAQVPPPPRVVATPRPWWHWAAGGAAMLLVVAGGAAYGAYSSWLSGNRIAPGLYIQGEPVGGLTAKEAQKRLEKRFGRLFVEFKTPERGYKLALKQVGGQPQFNRAVLNAYYYGRGGNPVQNVWKVFAARNEPVSLKLPVKWDKARMRQTMHVVARNYYQKPQDASLQVTGDSVQVIADQRGQAINVGATLLGLQKKYFIGLPSVPAVTKSVRPRLVAADLAGQDVLLGTYTTRFDSGLWGRTRNIYVAAETVNGKVLMPNQVFSFNQSTGERTWDKGYRMAHIFERKPGKTEAEVVDGLAGGVCQVSSTLFNAVRKSNRKVDGNLRIVERNYHSLPVTYVPSGLDATVAWPAKDFRFRNTLPHPIYLRTNVVGSRLTITVWGRVPEDSREFAQMVSEDAKRTSTPVR